MSKSVASALAALLVVVLMLGCGSQQPAAKKEEPKLDASVQTMDSMVVAAVAKTGPYAGVGQALADLYAWLGKNKVQPAGGPCGVYYTGPEVPQDSAKWEVCVPVPAGTKGDKDVVVKTMPPAQVAMTLHVGPFVNAGATYEKLAKWIDENGYTVAGPAMVFYLSDPSTTPAESLKMNVAFPVAAKQAEQPTETQTQPGKTTK